MAKKCYRPLVLVLYFSSEHMASESTDPRKLFFSFQNYVDIYTCVKKWTGDNIAEALAILFLLLLFAGPQKGPALTELPRWQLIGGLLGPIYVVVLTLATPHIGIAMTMIAKTRTNTTDRPSITHPLGKRRDADRSSPTGL